MTVSKYYQWQKCWSLMCFNTLKLENGRENNKQYFIRSTDRANIYRIHFVLSCCMSFRSQVVKVWINTREQYLCHWWYLRRSEGMKPPSPFCEPALLLTALSLVIHGSKNTCCRLQAVHPLLFRRSVRTSRHILRTLQNSIASDGIYRNDSILRL